MTDPSHQRIRLVLPIAATAALAMFVAAMVWQSCVWKTNRHEALPSTLWVYGGAFTVVWTLLSVLAWRITAPGKTTEMPNAPREAHEGNRQEKSSSRCARCLRGFLLDVPRNRFIAGRERRPASFTRKAMMIVAVALFARLTTALLTQPVLSNDIWRYIHDGAMLAQGTNPYATAPAELVAGQAPVPDAWARLNNAELTTIYQPTSQYVFALLEWVHAHMPAAFRAFDTAHDHTYRLGFIAFDLIVIALLLGQLHRLGRSPWWAALYAWHPLAISEVAGSGHQDVIGIACLVGALVMAHGLAQPTHEASVQPRRTTTHAMLAGGLFALAVAVKPIVLPLALPLAWRASRSGWRAVCMAAAATLAVGVACYLPFALMEGGLAGMIETARTFMNKWAFNGSMHALAQWAVGDKIWADRLMGAGLLAVLAAVTFARCDVWRASGIYLLAGVLLSSTVHPWYVLWALAMVAVRFDPVTWVLSLTVVLGYEAHLHPATFKPADWVAWAVYLPVYGALAAVGVWGAMRWHRSSGSAANHVAS